jgi:serine/threonine protein kinase
MLPFEGPREHRTLSSQDYQSILDDCMVIRTSDEATIYITSPDKPSFSCLGLPGHSTGGAKVHRCVIKRPRRYRDFLSERDMLKSCNRRNNLHIVPLIGSFDFEGAGHLIMPAASMDLATLWRKDLAEVTELLAAARTENWLISQLIGLARALGVIHGHLDTATAEKIFGLHGDIKASNILLFLFSGGTKPGVLKLADFGSSQLFDSQDRASHVESGGSSGTYAAPECVLERPYSQAIDLWSFGCFMLEFVIWLLQGGDGVQEFASSRAHKSCPYGMSLEADYFFRLEPKDPVDGDANPFVRSVNPAASARISELKHHEKCSDTVRALLDLVGQYVLLVDPAKRIPAEELCKKLKDLAKDDHNGETAPWTKSQQNRSVVD